MLYSEKLNKYDIEVKTAVERLFNKAFKFQSDPNDLLLIIIHGHYDEGLANSSNISLPKLSPFVFGPGEEGLMNDSQYEFYHWYRQSYLINGDATKHREYLKTKRDWYLEQSIITQMELMVYLKFWESDLILKQFYNLCRLIHGEHYDWFKKLGSSRKKLIEHDIKNKCRIAVPKFYELIEKTYIRQIRNAAAHSQIRIAGDYLNLFNYDPHAGFNLKSITIEEWETVFHKTILLYNHLIGYLERFHNHYIDLARDLHFGHSLRITKRHGITQHEFIRLTEPVNDSRHWIWYSTFDQHYIKRFHIVIK